jgi:hypothetical protein
MANTINATTGGIVSTGDSTATLDIQTGGVTAISIGSGQSVTISNLADANGSLRNIPSAGAAKTADYTLTVSDIGEFVTVGTSGSITVPNDVFSAGNAVSIYNDTTGNVTITCSITTAYIAGTDSDKATMTLSTRGIATILFINPSLCVATGNLT